MKYCLCLLLISATSVFASNTNKPPDATILVRLVKVSHSPSELHYLVATFEPIRIVGMAGGGRGPGSFPPPTVETNNGKEFTVSFIKPALSAHDQTLCHVIESCAGKRGADVSALKLHLVLSIPAEAATPFSSDAERDFSQWIIMSVDTSK